MMKKAMSEGRRSTGRDGLLGGKSKSRDVGVKAAKVGGKPGIKKSTVKKDHSKAPKRGGKAMNMGNDY